MKDRFRQTLRNSVRDERGLALPAAIIISMLFVMLASAGIYLSMSGALQATEYDDQQTAVAAATDGIEYAEMELNRQPSPAFYDGGTDDSAWSVQRGGKSLDPEGDGSQTNVTIRYVAEVEEGVYQYDIRSSGKYREAGHRIKGNAYVNEDGTDSWGPVALDDTGGGRLRNLIRTNVLANDYDPDEQPLTVVSWTQARYGSVSCEETGICTYINNTRLGTDTYTYTVSDPDGQKATATVTVTVTDPPTVSSSPPAAEADEREMMRGNVKTLNVLANDLPGDDDRGAITMTSRDENGIRGTLNCQRSGQCSYRAPASQSIKREVWFYEIADDVGPGDPKRAKVTIDIMDAPEPPPPPVRENVPEQVKLCVSQPEAEKVLGRKRAENIREGRVDITRNDPSGTNNADLMYVSSAIQGQVRGNGGSDVIVVTGNVQSAISGGPGEDVVCALSGVQGDIYGDDIYGFTREEGPSDAVIVRGPQREVKIANGGAVDYAVSLGGYAPGSGPSLQKDSNDRARGFPK